jgi:hypothetical protein
LHHEVGSASQHFGAAIQLLQDGISFGQCFWRVNFNFADHCWYPDLPNRLDNKASHTDQKSTNGKVLENFRVRF